MAKRVQRRRGTTAEHATFTGYDGESTIDTTKDTVVVHDGTVAGGYPLARYLTRRVTLKDGFDATDLTVHLTCNRQAGTSVKVYYKVLSQFDPDTFDNKLWTLMSETSNSNSVSRSEEDGEYLELEFNPSGTTASYQVGAVTYGNFKTFSVKIVMSSASTTKVPLIQDLRVIAMA